MLFQSDKNSEKFFQCVTLFPSMRISYNIALFSLFKENT